MSKVTLKTRRRQNGYFLTEALVYISVVIVILSVGYMALYRSIDNSLLLRRSAEDISAALKVGELWRADIRNAERVEVENTPDGPVVTMASSTVRCAWRHGGKSALRRVGDGPWVNVLSNVRAFSAQPDPRGQLVPWRLELELFTRSKTARVVPLFTFTALPNSTGQK